MKQVQEVVDRSDNICRRNMLNRLIDNAICDNFNYFAFIKRDRKSTRLNSSHVKISYAVFCLKKKKTSQQCATLKPDLNPSYSAGKTYECFVGTSVVMW